MAKNDWTDGQVVDAADLNALATQVNTNATDITANDTELATLTSEQAVDNYLFNAAILCQPTGQFCTLPRAQQNNSVAINSGDVNLTYFQAPVAMTINNVGTNSGDTAAVSVTTAKVGIYSVDDVSGDLSLVASTANTTTLWGSSFNSYQTAMAAPADLTAGTWYAVGIFAVATTMPSVIGNFVVDDANLAPRLCGLLTGQTDLPSSILGSDIGHNYRTFYTRLY